MKIQVFDKLCECVPRSWMFFVSWILCNLQRKHTYILLLKNTWPTCLQLTLASYLVTKAEKCDKEGSCKYTVQEEATHVDNFCNSVTMSYRTPEAIAHGSGQIHHRNLSNWTKIELNNNIKTTEQQLYDIWEKTPKRIWSKMHIRSTS